MVVRLGLLAVWIAVALAPVAAAVLPDARDGAVVEADLGPSGAEAVEAARVAPVPGPPDSRRPMGTALGTAPDSRADAGREAATNGVGRHRGVPPADARRRPVLRL